jgi:two-component system chemotaxis response regulator CheY
LPIKEEVPKMALNVLIVDDSAVMRAMILKTLHMSGMPLGDIHQAANGREGLAVFDDHWIDLVMLDINMPVMNGLEMMERMQKHPDLRDTPTIVISTEGSETRIKRLQAKGARFIRKPFTPEMIRDTV